MRSRAEKLRAVGRRKGKKRGGGTYGNAGWKQGSNRIESMPSRILFVEKEKAKKKGRGATKKQAGSRAIMQTRGTSDGSKPMFAESEESRHNNLNLSRAPEGRPIRNLQGDKRQPKTTRSQLGAT